MSMLASQVAGGGSFTVDASDATTLSTSSNVSVLRNGSVVSQPLSGGTLQWVATLDGTGTDYTLGVALDAQNNVFVANYNQTNLNIYNNSGALAATLQPTMSGYAASLVKFDSSGFFSWAVIVDGASDDAGMDVATDSSGNAYLVGYYTSSSPNIYNTSGVVVTSLRASTLSAVFLAKFSSTGAFQWAVTIDGSGYDNGAQVATDPQGNVYISGTYNPTGAQIYGTGGSSVTTLRTVSAYASFVAKFDSSGIYQWITVIDGTNVDYALALSVDNGGNVYSTGYYTTNATVVDSTTNVVKTLPTASGTSFAGYILKLTTSGTFQWVNTFDGASGDYGNSIATDIMGNIYVSGRYDASGVQIYNNAGVVVSTLRNGVNGAAMVIKLDASGTFQWATTIDGAGDDMGYGIGTDASGNVYVSGTYNPSGAQVYNISGIAVASLRTAANSAGFVVKYDGLGGYQWGVSFDGTGADNGYGLAISSQGRIYITGAYNASGFMFYNTSGIASTTLRTTAGTAGFLACLSGDGTVVTSTPYILPTANLTSTNNGFQKLIYHAANSNTETAIINVTNSSGTTLNTYSIGQGSNVSLVWVDTQWLRLA